MKITTVIVTPDLAKNLISNNECNRKIKKDRVLKYANDMKSGSWRQGTAETIKVSSSGRLLDGQHRLHAVIKSGISVEMLVATELNDDIFPVIDSGASRGAGDVFSIAQVKYPNETSSIINNRIKLIEALKSKGAFSNSKSISSQDVLDCYQNAPTVFDGIVLNTIRWHNAFGKVVTKSTIGSIYSVLYTIDNNKSFEFFEFLCTGVNIKSEMFYHIRNTFIKDRVGTKRMSNYKKIALIIRAWNKYTSGDNTNCRFDEIKDEFPIPLGFNPQQSAQII